LDALRASLIAKERPAAMMVAAEAAEPAVQRTSALKMCAGRLVRPDAVMLCVAPMIAV